MRKQGRFLTLVFSLLIILTVTLQQNLNSDDAERIKKGVETGKELVQVLTGDVFKDAIKLAGTIAGPLFMVASLILDIVFSFLKQESEEMGFMREQFKVLNNRLDKVDERFDQVIREVKWSTTQLQYVKCEQKIHLLIKDVNGLANAKQDTAEFYKQKFLQSFESSFSDCARRLAQGATLNGALFSENLISSVMDYTRNHRPKVQNFMTGLLRLITAGMQIEATYYKLKYGQDQMNLIQKDWEQIMNNVKNVMESCDARLESGWNAQLDTDIYSFAVEQQSKSHHDFANSFRAFLEEKYESKEFIVIAYNELHGFQEHTILMCRCKTQFRTAGRNLVVCWAEKWYPVWSPEERSREVSDTLSKNGHMFTNGGANANNLFNRYDHSCHRYGTLAVFKSHNGWGIASNPSRYVWNHLHLKNCAWILLNQCNIPKLELFDVIKFK